jgi:hypothetical protein
LRDRNGGKNADDRNDDHQFDKGEAFLLHLFLPFVGLKNASTDMPDPGIASGHCGAGILAELHEAIHFRPI